jgi:predicted dinucleotide-binding enzyme
MNLAFIGIGNVGFALADRLQKLGHRVVVGHHNLQSKSVLKALDQNPNLLVAPLQKAIDESEVVFLAIPFMKAQETLNDLVLEGKVLVDCTNPVGPGVSHALGTISGSEKIQEWSQTKVIKAFTVYGFENFEDPAFPKYNVLPVMPIAGDDLETKQEITPIIESLGFEVLDVGPLSSALHLEHMTLLWVKMVRMQGRDPRFTWGLLQK